jgi:predicted glycoside hydrolase/deacetylase ChbG (UPF0249 family)
MKIIINCDDLGESTFINDRILDLMEAGRVTSATLLMNGPAVDDAVRRIGRYPHMSFGVHLNVTQFRPLCSHPGLAPLLNEEGEFEGREKYGGNLRRMRLTTGIAEGIFAEWSAQIERALALRIPVSHLDSHHFTHKIPSLFRVFKRVQKKYGISKIRITENVFGVHKIVSPMRRAAGLALNFAFRHYVQTKTTDGFCEFSTFHERLLAGLGWHGSIELMCHPGSNREEYSYDAALLYGNWREELAKDAKLISYNEL